MATRTITAMFHDRSQAERAAVAIRANTALTATDVKILPEQTSTTIEAPVPSPHDNGGFMSALRNFFMPEEDRHGYAEAMRRGSVMVAVEADDSHAYQVMDVLEDAGAVDLDAEEAKWRQEGWTGYEPSSSATANATMIDPAAIDTAGDTTIPPAFGASAPIAAPIAARGATAAPGAESSAVTAGAMASEPTPAPATPVPPTSPASTSPASTSPAGTSMAERDTLAAGGAEERIRLVEENLRVGKRQVVQGRVRIRSYVVETPVTETVRLREEHVEVERRPVDRPLSDTDGDLFREREIEAVETYEEPVVAKESRVREELVVRKAIEERDETVKDTVRRTEVRQDEGDTGSSGSGAVRNPDGSKV